MKSIRYKEGGIDLSMICPFKMKILIISYTKLITEKEAKKWQKKV